MLPAVPLVVFASSVPAVNVIASIYEIHRPSTLPNNLAARLLHPRNPHLPLMRPSRHNPRRDHRDSKQYQVMYLVAGDHITHWDGLCVEMAGDHSHSFTIDNWGTRTGGKVTTVCDNAMGKVTTIPETLVTDDLEGCVTAQDVVTQDVKATATRYAAATDTTRKISTASHTTVPSLTPTTVKSQGGHIRPTWPLILPPLATFLLSGVLNTLTNVPPISVA
jgi:hypothetical protein